MSNKRRNRQVEQIRVTWSSTVDLEETIAAMFPPAATPPPSDQLESIQVQSIQQTTPVVITPVETIASKTTPVETEPLAPLISTKTPTKTTPVDIRQNKTTPVVITPHISGPSITTPAEMTPVVHFQPETIPVKEGRPAHRATQAQDGHSHSEQLIYDILWRAAKPSTDSDLYRLVQIPQSELASMVRMTTKNLRLALDRLAEKLAIEESQSFNRGSRIPRQWKVYSYKAILERRRKAGMEWIVRDRGVRFVPIETTGVKTTRVVIPQRETTGVKTTETTGVDRARTTGVESTPPSLGKEDREEIKVTTSASVARALDKTLGHSDEGAVLLILNNCHQARPDVTDEEIIHFIEQHGPRFLKMKTVDNPMGLLIRHLPQCLKGESFERYRKAAQQRREAAAAEEQLFRSEQQAILDNPNSNVEEKEWARQMLGLEKA